MPSELPTRAATNQPAVYSWQLTSTYFRLTAQRSAVMATPHGSILSEWFICGVGLSSKEWPGLLPLEGVGNFSGKTTLNPKTRFPAHSVHSEAFGALVLFSHSKAVNV